MIWGVPKIVSKMCIKIVAEMFHPLFLWPCPFPETLLVVSKVPGPHGAESGRWGRGWFLSVTVSMHASHVNDGLTN